MQPPPLSHVEQSAMSGDTYLKTARSLRVTAATGIAGVTAVVGVPFGVANLVLGHYAVAASSLGLAVLLCVHAAGLKWRPRLTSFTSLLILPAGVLFLAIAVHSRGALGLFWGYTVILGFYGLLEERIAWIANITLLVVVLPIAYVSVELAFVLRSSATLIVLSAFSAVLVHMAHDHHRMLFRRMETDVLTGVLNRQSLSSALADAHKNFLKHGESVSLVAIDVDNFKRINDGRGHVVGDRVLQLLGSSLKRHAGTGSSVFRIGGDEFLVLLPNVTHVDAYHICDALRCHAQSAANPSGVYVTLCAGAACLESGQSVEEWVAAADEALYRAKAEGRNKTVLATTTTNTESAESKKDKSVTSIHAA